MEGAYESSRSILSPRQALATVRPVHGPICAWSYVRLRCVLWRFAEIERRIGYLNRRGGAPGLLGALLHGMDRVNGLFSHVLKEPSIRSKTGFFWLALIYPSLYIFVFIALLISSSTRVSAWGILPAHLFAMVCIFYVTYFASKGLAIAEASRPVTFYDCAGPLFLIWFFPLGVWFVQPKINRLLAKSRRAQASIQPAAPQ